MNLPYKRINMHFQSSDPRNILPVKKVKQYKNFFFFLTGQWDAARANLNLLQTAAGSVAYWRARQTLNPTRTVPGSSSVLATCWIFFMVITISNLQPRLSIANMLPPAS